MINIRETIKNIQANCDNYADPELVCVVINDDNTMGTNNILQLEDYNVNPEDSYEENVLRVLEHKDIFLTCGMYAFVPVINECDIYSTEDYNFRLTDEEFKKYAHEKERLFGVLIKKNKFDYLIGSTDLCNCSADASFIEIEKTDLDFYNKLEEIIKEKIIV